ncbi:MAG: hypothetical protein M2R45_05253 [Verrucomicrobia subdivision 3 bacterium]|nr:hypothetical protein [Limisphaerales bacterium]MCS1416851.1 hypothetical protein [Limisphaerales bacterium]
MLENSLAPSLGVHKKANRRIVLHFMGSQQFNEVLLGSLPQSSAILIPEDGCYHKREVNFKKVG